VRGVVPLAFGWESSRLRLVRVRVLSFAGGVGGSPLVCGRWWVVAGDQGGVLACRSRSVWSVFARSIRARAPCFRFNRPDGRGSGYVRGVVPLAFG